MPSKAERRVALVIGNAAYRVATALDNPVNDALRMADTLERLRFEVKMVSDCDINDLDSNLRAFTRRLEGTDVGLLYYSGHAIQFNGENYLIPVDARLEEPEDLEKRAFSLSTQLANMRRAAHVSLVFLDACREDPFRLDRAAAVPGSRSVAVQRAGLKEVEKAALKDALIAFAAEQGHVAVDGEKGGLSPFTRALLECIDRPGLEVTEMMRLVRRSVREATNGKQVPWSNDALTSAFFFVPPGEWATPWDGAPSERPTAPEDAGPRAAQTDDPGSRRNQKDQPSSPLRSNHDIPGAISAFVGSDPVTGEAAIAVLATLGPSALTDILKQTSGSYQQKVRLRKLCGRLGPAAVPHLLNAIENGEWQLKLAAAPCFSAFRGNRGAMDGLYQLLKVRDFDVQRLAIEAIGHVGYDVITSAIVRLTIHDDLDARLEGIEPVNRYSLQKLHTYVIEALMRIFGQTGQGAILNEIEQLADVCAKEGYETQISSSIRYARDDLAPVAADALMNTWLRHPEQQFREYAVDCLAHLRLRRTMSSLGIVLLNPNEAAQLRQSAAIAIGAVDSIHAARYLATLLEKNPQGANINWAFSTLYCQPIEWPEASRHVESALSSTGEIRQQMLVSLGWRRDATFRSDIEKGLDGDDSFDRGTCALALAHLSGRDAIDALMHCADEASSEIERLFAIAAQVHAGIAGRADSLHRALQELPQLPSLRPIWRREVLSAMTFADSDPLRAQLWAEIAGEDLQAIISNVRTLQLAASRG